MERSRSRIFKTINESSGAGALPTSRGLRTLSAQDEGTQLRSDCFSLHVDPSHAEMSSHCSPPLGENGTSRCMLIEMPPEILLHITRYVVGPLRLIQFSSRNMVRDRKIVKTVEQQYARDRCSPAPMRASDRCEHVPRQGENLTAMASTCRLLNDSWNTVFYGESKFVFELGKSPYFCGYENGIRSCPPSDATYTLRRFHPIEPHAIWPLTKHTIRFLKDLTVIALMPEGQLSWNSETQAFYQPVTSMIRMAVASKQRLRRLAVYFDVMRFRFTTCSLKFERDHDETYRIAGLSMTESGGWDMSMRTAWWQLWEAYEGRVREVHLGGGITKALKKELEATLLIRTTEHDTIAEE